MIIIMIIMIIIIIIMIICEVKLGTDSRVAHTIRIEADTKGGALNLL